MVIPPPVIDPTSAAPGPTQAAAGPTPPAAGPTPDTAPPARRTRGRRADWADLSPAAKTERLLGAAAQVFAERGLETPMSVVAAAAGAGVGSVYRMFPSKRELLAALVTRRMEQIARAATEAEAGQGDRFEALCTMIRTLVETQSADDFMGEARARVSGHEGVQAATGQATIALERMMDAARSEGRLRPDATTLDLRLLFAATRAARRVEPGQWQRMLELLLDALEARPQPGP